MSELANRLIKVAHEAIWNDTTGHPDEEARAATAAVLREVADELFEELLDRVGPGMVVRPNVVPELLRQWAEVVERGEQQNGAWRASWHHGPTVTDPEPGKVWCDDCGGEVMFFEEGAACGCSDEGGQRVEGGEQG